MLADSEHKGKEWVIAIRSEAKSIFFLKPSGREAGQEGSNGDSAPCHSAREHAVSMQCKHCSLFDVAYMYHVQFNSTLIASYNFMQRYVVQSVT